MYVPAHVGPNLHMFLTAISLPDSSAGVHGGSLVISRGSRPPLCLFAAVMAATCAWLWCTGAGPCCLRWPCMHKGGPGQGGRSVGPGREEEAGCRIVIHPALLVYVQRDCHTVFSCRYIDVHTVFSCRYVDVQGHQPRGGAHLRIRTAQPWGDQGTAEREHLGSTTLFLWNESMHGVHA